MLLEESATYVPHFVYRMWHTTPGQLCSRWLWQHQRTLKWRYIFNVKDNRMVLHPVLQGTVVQNPMMPQLSVVKSLRGRKLPVLSGIDGILSLPYYFSRSRASVSSCMQKWVNVTFLVCYAAPGWFRGSRWWSLPFLVDNCCVIWERCLMGN